MVATPSQLSLVGQDHLDTSAGSKQPNRNTIAHKKQVHDLSKQSCEKENQIRHSDNQRMAKGSVLSDSCNISKSEMTSRSNATRRHNMEESFNPFSVQGPTKKNTFQCRAQPAQSSTFTSGQDFDSKMDELAASEDQYQ